MLINHATVTVLFQKHVGNAELHVEEKGQKMNQ